MIGYKSLRRWLQIKTKCYDTPIDGEVPFWVMSLGFHLILLVLLAKILIVPQNRDDVVLVVDTTETVLIEPPQTPPELSFDDTPIEDLGDDSDEAFKLDEVETPTVEFVSDYSTEVEMAPEFEVSEELATLDLGTVGSGGPVPIRVKGSGGVATSGTSGAVDRLTKEILIKLQDNKTLVVWLFDQSASLIRQRDEIRNRIDRIYSELKLLEAAKSGAFTKYEDKPLLTHVYAFGQNVGPILKEATDDVEKIKASLTMIPRDNTGIENVFSAVLRCVDDFRDYRKLNRPKEKRRNVMFVIVSDEAGDDGQFVDNAVQACNRYQIPVYTIGVPAPFGRQYTQVKWVDPDPQFDQSPQYAPVTQGPESLYPERLRLQFTGGNFDDLESIDSGFGPFNLTRLCSETSGVYIAVHPNRRTGRVRTTETKAYAADLRYFYDPEIMGKDRPDYISRKEYERRAKEIRSRTALVRAATFSQTGQLEPPQFRFERLNETTFTRQLSQAQRAPAILQPKLDQLYEILKAGEDDRARETSLRWQAGYELAYGRVLAARVRTKAYNEMLAIAKTKLKFKNPKNNTWVLKPADTISTGSQDQKHATKAKEYLQRVISKHPGTPWAMLAQRELRTPLGWKWTETFTKPPEPPRQRQVNNNNNNNPVPPRNPMPRQNAMPKEKRQPPKL